jgi:anaerobic ribonucleoside-triphosphate reductase
MDLLPFGSQIPGMGQTLPDSRCPNCGFTMPGDRNRLGRFECAKCDRLDPLKSERAKGWLQGELRPPK